MSDTSYGFIGLGNMGAPMCANLCAAGFAPVVFDAAGTAERAPEGATVADSIAAVAQQDTVFLSLPDGKVVAAVCAEILAVPDRRVSTVANFSTTGPAAAGETDAALAAGGITFVDAPVSGGKAGAIAGTVTVIASGPDDAVAALAGPFDAVGGNTFHVGTTPGQGQAVKLLNNFLSATAMAATSEAVRFGLGHGVAMETILDVVNVSTGRNTASADKFPNRVATETFDAGFAMALMTKDVALYADEVRKAGAPDDIGAAMTALWNAADAAMPGADFTEIYRFIGAKGDGAKETEGRRRMSGDARPVALVTGASYGLGAAIAARLAGDGFDVAVTELDPADLADTRAAIEAAGGGSEGVALDLRSDASIAAAVNAVLDRFGRIDLLVNNAAMLVAKPALDVAAAEFEAVTRINVTGTFLMTQHVGRHLIESGRPGQIINIASTFTTVGAVNVSPYGISKAAIGGLTRHLAAEWAPHDIRVNAVAPGTSMTKLRAEIFDNDAARREAGLSKIPLGRFTDPEDIAGAVSYLASPAAAYVTGHILAVDGGMTVT